MKIKPAELQGAALDWAVWKIEHGGAKSAGELEAALSPFAPSTDWAQGGPIIERERIDIWCYESDLSIFRANIQGSKKPDQQGKTMLIAAMRCYVASKLGEEVDVPEELS